MTNRLLIVTLFMLLAFDPFGLEAADWRSVVDLRGSWLFTVGDDEDWSSLDLDVSDWDKLQTPREWEHFYPGYNGFGWYRKSFSFTATTEDQAYVLFLGFIDDVDEVFINGVKVGKSGKFPPNFKTAFSRERRYQIPENVLRSGTNVIAVRVFDEAKEGGIHRADQFGIYYDRDENIMDLNLSGSWKFSRDYEKGLKQVKFDDQQWENIHVPMNWENQGYEEYDGTAWYRKAFNLPDRLNDKELMLVLGRIDDFDKVYFNGQLIGQVEDLSGYSRFEKGNAYRLFRAYRIPKELLRQKNLIVVEVEDMSGEGGIYEGPVGIIEQQKAESIIQKYSSENRNSGWGSFMRDLINWLDY